jgi:hypothetical protein
VGDPRRPARPSRGLCLTISVEMAAKSRGPRLRCRHLIYWWTALHPDAAANLGFARCAVTPAINRVSSRPQHRWMSGPDEGACPPPRVRRARWRLRETQSGA